MTVDSLQIREEDALAAWAVRVRADREQVARLREVDESSDFYAPIASAFSADPHRTDDPSLNALRRLIEPDETWMDIGAGGGRLALPIALLAGSVIAVEPSDGMLAVLREGMRQHGIENIEIVQSRWPMDDAPLADVAFIAHVGYDIEEIGPFIDAMERSARRQCVAMLLNEPPRAIVAELWRDVHGEELVRLPALPEFLALLLARRRLFEVQLSVRAPVSYPDRDAALPFMRRQLWTSPGSAKDKHLLSLLDERLQERDGRYWLTSRESAVGIVSWTAAV